MHKSKPSAEQHSSASTGVIWSAFGRVAPWCCILLPAVALLLLIRRYGVNIPFLDDWMFVHMFEQERDGVLGLHDFFMVQMEHRMAFVRAVIMLCHKLWPADYTKQMWVSWALLTGTGVNVALLLRRTAGTAFRRWWPLLALASVAIFSPIQYRIVLWPMMFQVACPAFFLSLAIVTLLSGLPLWLRYLLGVTSAICATLTFATGILVWVLIFPLILWGGAVQRTGARWIYAALWFVAFGITMGLYFHDLKNEVDPAFAYKAGEEETLHRDMKAFFMEPDRVAPYVCRFLGSHLARGTSFAMMDASLVIGALSLILFCGAALYWWRNFRRPELRERMLPWLLLGSYSVGAGLLVAMGRLWATHNGENSLASRYVIHAVPLTVALIVLAWMIVRDVQEQRPEHGWPAAQGLTGLCLVYLMLQFISWQHGVRLMDMWESSRLRGATNTLFYNRIPQMDDSVPANRDLARRANSMGLLSPPMLKSQRLDNFAISKAGINPNTGTWKSLVVEKPEEAKPADPPRGSITAAQPEQPPGLEADVQGFAYLPERKRVADGVFLTWKDKTDNHWEIFQVVQVDALPLYLRGTLGRDLQFVHVPGGDLEGDAFGSFHGKFPLSIVDGKGVVELAAWAFDYKRQEVYRMAGSFELDTINGVVKARENVGRGKRRGG